MESNEVEAEKNVRIRLAEIVLNLCTSLGSSENIQDLKYRIQEYREHFQKIREKYDIDTSPYNTIIKLSVPAETPKNLREKYERLFNSLP